MMRYLPQTRGLYHLTIVLIICIALARIISTYHEFTQTVDEPFHIACGMQLLQQGHYDIELQHPPLARIFVALGPYLAGLRLPNFEGGSEHGTELGNAILNGNINYWHNLALARLGTLPFFVLACAVVWFWANHISGKRAAFFSLLVFSLLPPVLGHSSLATTDMAAAATLCLALYCFALWIENPSWPVTAGLGVGIGLALVSKFSMLLFFPVCAIAMVLLCLATGKGSFREHPFWKLSGKAVVCLAVACFVIWAGYLFTLAPLEATRPHAMVDRFFQSYPSTHHLLEAILETPVPDGQVPKSIAALADHNRGGHSAFFLGQWRRHGWWYFFPVIFLVKTPLAFLLLSCIGGVFVARSFKGEHDWRRVAPLGCALAIMASSLVSNIDIGLRHLLAIYLPLSIVSGDAASQLLGSIRRPMVSRAVIAGIFIWLAGSSVLAHPDYLAYFNVFAFGRPERIEVDSDLDWGQDLYRLSKWLKLQGVRDVGLSYFGTADLSHADLPNFHELIPYQKESGWVAISAYNRTLPSPFFVKRLPNIATYYGIPWNFDRLKSGEGPFAWLTNYQPVAKIGNSIFVYNIAQQK